MNAEIAHHVAGRLRLKIADIRGSAERALALQQHVGRLTGVIDAKAHQTAGSLTIRYDRSRDAAVREALAEVFPDLKQAAWERRYQPSRNGHAGGAGLNSNVSALLTVVNKRLRRETGGIDLNTLLPLSLLILAAAFFLRAIVTRKMPVPGWYELIWFAFATYMMLNSTPSEPSPQGLTPADK